MFRSRRRFILVLVSMATYLMFKLFSRKPISIKKSYISNPNLKTIKTDWPGTPLDQDGRFMNYLQPMQLDFIDVLKWQLSNNPDKPAKKNENYKPQIIDAEPFLTSKEDGIVWLGHASFLIRIDGKLICIDPVFGSLSVAMKRFGQLPLDAKNLINLDYILLSHDHRDHADEKSMKQIAAQNPNAIYLTGLENNHLLEKWTNSSRIEAAGWFQQFSLSDLKITYVPSRHWCRRFLFDTNQRLWGGFVIEGKSKTIYFGGDSGYGPHFKDISSVFPKIDVALLGIGAYKPEWFMAQSHMSPQDALKTHRELGAKTLIPMHYGTFDLSDEALSDPAKNLKKAISSENVRITNVGEVFELN